MDNLPDQEQHIQMKSIYDEDNQNKILLIKKCNNMIEKNNKLFDKYLIKNILNYYKPLTDIFNKYFADEWYDLYPGITIYISYKSWDKRVISAYYLVDRPDKYPTKYKKYPKIYYLSNKNFSPSIIAFCTKLHPQILRRNNQNNELCWVYEYDDDCRIHDIVDISEVWNDLLLSLDK